MVNEDEGAISGGDEIHKVVVLPFQRVGWWTSGVGRERALLPGGEECEECRKNEDEKG